MFTLLICATAARAQQPVSIVLRPANARLSEEFSILSSVRELPDGRVLISDEKDKRVVVADLTANRVAQIGRAGDGPGEYRQPGLLYAAGGDTTLFADLATRRWLILSGSTHVRTLTYDMSALVKTGYRPFGADDHGHVLGRAFASRMANDSEFVTRYDRERDRLDTLGVAYTMPFNSGAASAPAIEPAGGRGGAGTGPGKFVVGLQMQDQFAMFGDGWVAIAHVRPYRVDWCAPPPAHACVRGAQIEPNRPMTERDKTAYLGWPRRKWPPVNDVAQTVGWPDIIPPFAAPQQRNDGRTVFPAPDGRLVIERFISADARPTQYDVVDRRGVLSARLVLPENQRIVGFGVKSVYVVVIDADDVEQLERHPW